MRATLSDLTLKARKTKVRWAIGCILADTDVPLTTGELVKRVTALLKERDQKYVAREFQRAMADGHPLRRATGEVFTRYHKTMPRYEWLPKSREAADEPEAEISEEQAWRIRRVAELEAGRPDPGPWPEEDDEWTVPAEEAEPEFLEED